VPLRVVPRASALAPAVAVVARSPVARSPVARVPDALVVAAVVPAAAPLRCDCAVVAVLCRFCARSVRSCCAVFARSDRVPAMSSR
jgi:hypothetical protein